MFCTLCILPLLCRTISSEISTPPARIHGRNSGARVALFCRKPSPTSWMEAEKVTAFHPHLRACRNQGASNPVFPLTLRGKVSSLAHSLRLSVIFRDTCAYFKYQTRDTGDLGCFWLSLISWTSLPTNLSPHL